MTVAGRFDTSKFAGQNDLPGKLPNKGFGISYQAKSELSHHYLVSKIVFVNLI